MTQLGLLDELVKVERPWKRVRAVSRQVYAELRKGGVVNKSTARVIVALAWYRNQYQEWPTCSELTRFMFTRKRLKREDTRAVAPRLTEMVKGGVCAYLRPRRCRVTGSMAGPISIREAGSLAREAA